MKKLMGLFIFIGIIIAVVALVYRMQNAHKGYQTVQQKPGGIS